MNYSNDMTSQHGPHWLEWLDKFRDREAKGLEVGCFEGRSSNWFVDNILTHPASTLRCVDPFTGGDTLPVYLDDHLYNVFVENTKANCDKIVIDRGESRICLSGLVSEGEKFDFIYVDGLHTANPVLLDCALAFELCKVGGILILDDYPWGWDRPAQQKPQIAIDCFMSCYADQLRLIHKEWQVALERMS